MGWIERSSMRRTFAAGITATLLAGCAPLESSAADTAPISNTLTASANSKQPEAETPKTFDWKKVVPSWFAAVDPFLVAGPKMGGIYYVGTEGLGMYFIPTEEGHIVIDGGMPGQGRYVADAIRQLGFDPADIKILLNSHAHMDHSGGLAELKALSGAQMIASEGDRSALEGGFYLGSEDDTRLNAPPIKVNVGFSDDFTLEHGGVALTAKLTPGHSRGCTSWMMDVEQGGETRQVLFFCSATVAANRLVGPPQYEGIVDDYRRTFAITKDWQPDIFLSNHPEFFGMKEKRAAQKAGDPLAFVDREGFPAMMIRLEAAFKAALQKQKGADK